MQGTGLITIWPNWEEDREINTQKPLKFFLTLPWEYYLEGQMGQRLDVFVDLTEGLGMLYFERSTLPALIQFPVPPNNY